MSGLVFFFLGGGGKGGCEKYLQFESFLKFKTDSFILIKT